jgi:acyl-CoA thioesterase
MTGALDRVTALWRDDPVAQSAGIHIDHVGEGTARLRMIARPDMGNGHGIVHGGWIFLLADTAFAYAFATRVDGGVTVNADVAFHRPARVGDELTATATESHLDGRAAIYDVEVHGPDGTRLASVRGHGRAPNNA